MKRTSVVLIALLLGVIIYTVRSVRSRSETSEIGITQGSPEVDPASEYAQDSRSNSVRVPLESPEENLFSNQRRLSPRAMGDLRVSLDALVKDDGFAVNAAQSAAESSESVDDLVKVYEARYTQLKREVALKELEKGNYSVHPPGGAGDVPEGRVGLWGRIGRFEFEDGQSERAEVRVTIEFGSNQELNEMSRALGELRTAAFSDIAYKWNLKPQTEREKLYRDSELARDELRKASTAFDDDEISLERYRVLSRELRSRMLDSRLQIDETTHLAKSKDGR